MLEDMGLGVSRKKMLWVCQGGALRWAPRPVKLAVMVAWNFVACRLYGHDWLLRREPYVCYTCSHGYKGNEAALDAALMEAYDQARRAKEAAEPEVSGEG